MNKEPDLTSPKIDSKPKFKLSLENAQAELDRLYDYYEIDIDDLPKAQQDAMVMVAGRLVKGLRKGRLSFSFVDGIFITQTLKNGAVIVYRELDGQSKTAMGTKSSDDNNGKMYALLGALSDGEAAVLKLTGADLSLAECLGSLFLSV